MIEKYFPQFSNMSLEQADALFEDDLVKFENLVNTKLKVQVTQNEFDALISFSWNCGYSETLFSLINSRSPKDVIGQWWRTHYITSNGNQLPGLVIRRTKEFNLFMAA